jgi:hypothetical protein
VTLRRYLDPVAAQLDRASLEAAGITAHVIEAASFNPFLSGAAGGAQLQVGERDVGRAEAILASHGPGSEDASADDGEGTDVVRCPRCELAYCSLERPQLRTGSLFMPIVALVTLPLLPFAKRRWHCQKCRHEWDDPKEGPAAMTRLEPGDPRPVFRLRRAHAGMGLFVGLMVGFLGGMVTSFVLGAGGGAVGVFLLAPVAGWLVGRSLRYDVCSEPGCRAPLPPGEEDCPRCRGAIAGSIDAAEQHFPAAADFRRELAALRREPAPAKKRKKKAKLREAV